VEIERGPKDDRAQAIESKSGTELTKRYRKKSTENLGGFEEEERVKQRPSYTLKGKESDRSDQRKSYACLNLMLQAR